MGQGRKPLPDGIKQARGEKRPCRKSETVIDFPPVPGVPDPPKWVNNEGKKLWKEIAPALFVQRVLTIADSYALSHLCQLHGEIISCYRRKIAPTASQLNQLRSYFAEFGMTPASRTKVGPNGGGKKDNKFQKNSPQVPTD